MAVVFPLSISVTLSLFALTALEFCEVRSSLFTLLERLLAPQEMISSLVKSEEMDRREVKKLNGCFTSTETIGLLGTGAQDIHLNCHTDPEL